MKGLTEQNVENIPPNKLYPQIIAVISCLFGQFSIGMSFGWTSPALDKLLGDDSPIPTTSSQGSTIGSIMIIGGVIAPILYSLKVDRLGRKWMAFFGAIFFMISWIVLIFCTEVYHVYIARIFIGLGMGYTYGLIPTYIGEITETHVRSLFGVFISVLFSLGVIFQYSLGPYVDFYTLNTVNLTFPTLMLISVFWMPESPYFLVRQNRMEDAQNTVMWLRGQKNLEFVEEEMQAILKFVAQSPKRPFVEVMKELWLKSNRKALLILTFLMIGQQFNGSSTVKAYFHLMIKDAGIKLDPNLTVLIVEILGLCVLIMSFFLINRVGRRVLYLTTCIGCCVGTFIVGLFFMLRDVNIIDDKASVMALAGFVCIQIFNGVGASSVPNIIVSEMSTASIRSWFGGYKAILLSALGSISIKIFQVIKDGIGDQYGYWLYTIILIFVTIGIYLILPETRGKTLQEIQDILAGNKKGGTKVLKSNSFIVSDT